jgi:hypothetical protein
VAQVRRAALLLALLAACESRPPASVATADAGAGADAAPGDAPADRPTTDTAINADADPGPPSRCLVTTDRQPPYPLTFHLLNHGASPVYVRDDGCVGITLDIASCASRFTDRLGPVFACACSCRDASCQGPPGCPPCAAPSGKAVLPGQALDVRWNAIALDFQNRTNDTCVDPRPLPAGIYSVSVAIFDAPDLSLGGGTPARFASRTFALPAPGDVVEVVLAPPDVVTPPACEAAAAAPVCAPPWAADVACALDGPYTVAWEGGNAPWFDSTRLTPPNVFTLTRHYGDQTPDRSCTSSVPRCAAGYGRYTTADFMAALAAPDVAAALAQPMALLYGYDSRNNDGSVLAVRRADGSGLLIGAACGVGSPCAREVTPGMLRLLAITAKLLEQQRAAAGCEAFRQP